MKYVKLFENFENRNVEDPEGIIELMGADTKVSISIGTGDDCFDMNIIPKMVEDYKVMYVRNDEWSGGPCNREWLDKYYMIFRASRSAAHKAWKPTVMLNIHTEHYGTAILGYSINSKKCVSYNWKDQGGKVKCEDCNGTGWAIPNYRRCRCDDGFVQNPIQKEAADQLYWYIQDRIYRPQLSYDDTIILLNLEEDFNFDPLLNSKFRMVNKL